ncbi:MAG: LrgB family protein [Rhodospirillales bacterium]|nr:LrgB family protein [Rhodospirillales bacterium]MDE2199649.1 LrgB family protein [Rhodospirillales bacterium]MDE2574071.1 LrgB family protein [Rhodospirillales bacterium]
MDKLFHLWVYLETTPLLGLAATLVVYRFAVMASRAAGGHILANPVLLSIGTLVLLLLATGTPYAAYFQGAQYIHFLLGPATVALALPMYSNLARIRRSAGAILPAILAGSATASLSAMLIARALGAPREVVVSVAVKSVTTPIAMGIAEQIGGDPSLAAAFVLITGVSAILLAGPSLWLAGIRDPRARGLAGGTAGHGLVTAHMLLTSETAGAFGGLAIGLNGLITAIIVPLLATLVVR